MSEDLEREQVEKAIELLQRQFYPNVAKYLKNNHPEMQENE